MGSPLLRSAGIRTISMGLAALLSGQSTLPLSAQAAGAPTTTSSSIPIKNIHEPTKKERDRALRNFMDASKAVKAHDYETAIRLYKEAIRLDPNHSGYPAALEVARNFAVTELIQKAARLRAQDDLAGSRAALAHAHELDPYSQQVGNHLRELGALATTDTFEPLYEKASGTIGETPDLGHSSEKKSFHLNAGMHEVIQQFYKAWGIQVTFDYSVPNNIVRVNVDDVSFPEAMQILHQLTKTYSVVLDPHRVIVARESVENRQRLDRQNLETVYFSGLAKDDLSEIDKLAKSIFGIQNASMSESQQAMTLRAGSENLNAFNATVRGLLEGHNQVLLDVRLIQLAHTNERVQGIQAPQSFVTYNLYAEAESIMSQNSSVVSEIVSSGLASSGDYMTILAILAEYGYVSSSLYENGLLSFGGGYSKSVISPGSDTIKLSVNSSDSKALDHVLLRLGDGEEGKIRLGERYPIETSSYSNSLSSSAASAVASSSSLSSLLAQYSSSYSVPMVEYQDLGLTVKATPKVMRSGNVALTLDLKLDALSGSTLGDNPILDSRSWSGVVTIKKGESTVVAQQLSKTQTKSVSGTPLISEIPGLSQLFADNDKDVNNSTLLIVITPHVLRSTQEGGHTPMMRLNSPGSSR